VRVARHGLPDQPADLERHRIVAGPVAPNSRSWKFERDCKTVVVEVQPHVSVNDTAGALAAATSGLGITPTTSWACRREIESGELVPILLDWQSGEFPVHAYFPKARTTRMAARAFIDFIANELHADPPRPV